LLAVLFVSPAAAHVSLTVKEARVGLTYKATLVVGHGCEGASTTTLRVQIPEGFYNAKPMPKAGWEVETVTGAYSAPFDNHGTQMNEGVREISWTEGDLPDGHFDEFVFRGTFGPAVKEGTRFHFPVIQLCGEKEDAWTDTSGSDAAEFPAPFLEVTPAAEGHH